MYKLDHIEHKSFVVIGIMLVLISIVGQFAGEKWNPLSTGLWGLILAAYAFLNWKDSE